VSSDWINRQSTPPQPIYEGDGFHCSDLGTASGLVDSTVGAVQTAALADIKNWLTAWQPTSSLVVKSAAGGSVSIPQAGSTVDIPKPINVFFKSSGTL
jgi:hypothetical protein